MGLSSSLLLLAITAGVVPVVMVGAQPPQRLRDVEKALVTSFVLVVAGTIVLNGVYDLSFFGLVHLLYLLAVVAVPIVLGSWFLLALRQGRRRLDSILVVVAALLAAGGLYGTHIEPRWLRVDRVEVVAAVPGPLRVGVIADLQTPQVGAHERDAIASVLAEQPDIVVIPGDWFQGSPEQILAQRADFVALLSELVESTALVAVTSGDSDWSVPLRPMVEEAGALFIDDSIHEFEIDGVPLRLAGVRVLADGPGRSNTLAALSAPSDAFTLLVSHRPDVVYDLPPDTDVDLIIAGHTHGGQVALPFIGPPVTFSSIPRDLAAGGLGIVDNVPLYVSAGVGLERKQAPQVRIGARPEVGIVNIVPG
ncbi:MAG: metallophosphoesterase [Actinomycetota bacterium]